MATKKATTKTTRTKSAAPKATKKAPTKTGAPTKAKAKRLSQIEAAVEVLRAAGEPMTCKAMAAKGLWTSPAGTSTDATLYASILRELARKGKDARFVKAAPGRFAAKA